MWAFFMPKTKVNRIRGRTLQAIRASHFRLHPLCVMCEAKGRITAAQELDHVKSLDHGGTNDSENYQGLCIDCHKEKSIKERGYTYKPKVTTGLDGWPVG